MTDRTDDFNRADGGLGANWTDLSDANHGASLQINTNQVKCVTNNDCASIWGADTFQNDQFSQATFVDHFGGANQSSGGCIVRGKQTGGTRYYDYAPGFGGFSSLIEYYDGSTWNWLASGSSATSGTHTVRCEIAGTSITGKLDGSTSLTATDASLSSGAPGLHIFEQTNNDATFDDWSGGPITAGGTLDTAWFRPSEERLPRKFLAGTCAAIALTPATPTPTISGMAWFEPPDRDKVPVKVRVESPPALALTPTTLPPQIAGMAWFEPLDNYPPRALGKSEPHSFSLGPTTPPTPISGMAWFAPPDRDRPAIKVSVEATPAWSPQVITPAVTAPLTGWWTNSDTVVRCGRRADDPSLIPFTPPQPVLWWSPEDCKPRAQRPLSDIPALSLRDTFQIAGIAWFEPPPDLPRRAAPYREQIAAICLTPPAPPVGISGMAWFAPLDRDRPKYRPTVEASPGWGPHFIAQVAPTPNKAEWLIRARRRGRR